MTIGLPMLQITFECENKESAVRHYHDPERWKTSNEETAMMSGNCTFRIVQRVKRLFMEHSNMIVTQRA